MDDLQKHLGQRGATGNVHRKHPRTTAPIGPTSTANIASAALESTNLEYTQSVALLVAPTKEREIHDIDHEVFDDGGSDDSNDEDYDDMNDDAASERRRSPRSRKRVKRAKDMEQNSVETHSLNVSYQTTAATSSVSVQESEEIPIHGYLTLKTTESKVVYCLTFSRGFLPEPSIAKNVSSSSNRRDSERAPVQEGAMKGPARNFPFSSEDDELLLQLKGEGLSWDEISDWFPNRGGGTLQVH